MRTEPLVRASRIWTAHDDVRRALRESQRADGGWSQGPTGPSASEATALAVLALGRDANAARGVTWLLRAANPDGSWPATPEVPASSWMTAPAVLALADLHDGGEAAERGAIWLAGIAGKRPPLGTRLLQRLLAARGREFDLDFSLTGWPWVAGTSSWVEPTAWAMLALRRTRAARLPWVRQRLADAERLLLDRACPGGGWNYGNGRVLGEALWPYPDTTALALLALQPRREEPVVAEGVAAMRRMLGETDSGLAVALGILALQAHGDDVAPVRARLTGIHRRTKLLDEPRALALAALALDERVAHFRTSVR